MLAQAYKHLTVYQRAIELAMGIFESSKSFPADEGYGLKGQIRVSSRLICSHLSEAWQNRFSAEIFITQLKNAESEVCKTRIWSEFACRCSYWNTELSADFQRECNRLFDQIAWMIDDAEDWILRK